MTNARSRKKLIGPKNLVNKSALLSREATKGTESTSRSTSSRIWKRLRFDVIGALVVLGIIG